MKQVTLDIFLILCLLVSACTGPTTLSSTSANTSAPVVQTLLPVPSSHFILEHDQAIAYSYEVLLQQGIEPRPGVSRAGTSFAIVRFPNDDQGVFVAIGLYGIARGYQFLYRIDGDQVELVEPIRQSQLVWGLEDAQGTKSEIEFLDQLIRASNSSRQTFKVTGVGHAGSGLWDEGYFEILQVTSNGLRVIFTGVETSTNSTTFNIHNQYQYVDLDGDGNKEIIEDSEYCEYRIEPSTWAKQDLGCNQSRKVYHFDGVIYKAEGDTI